MLINLIDYSWLGSDHCMFKGWRVGEVGLRTNILPYGVYHFVHEDMERQNSVDDRSSTDSIKNVSNFVVTFVSPSQV